MMTPAKDWSKQSWVSEEFIKRVQIDALNHARALCRSNYEECGHANRGVANCDDAIKKAIEELEQP